MTSKKEPAIPTDKLWKRAIDYLARTECSSVIDCARLLDSPAVQLASYLFEIAPHRVGWQMVLRAEAISEARKSKTPPRDQRT